MRTILIITEHTIRTFVGEQNFLKGQQAVRDGAIVNPVRQGMMLKAYCYGSLPEPYRVQVTFDDTGITTALCSCPAGSPTYGNRGCKHVAALLLTWQEQPETFVEMDDLDIILERKDKSELIAFIKQLLVKQPEVAWQLTMSPPTCKRKIPSIENYRDMRQLAGHLDRWETLRPELLSVLKTSRNALVLTQIALDEGDIESALALVKSQARRSYTSRNDRQIYTYDLGYHKVVFDVARVAEDSRPHAAIELYQQHVEALLVRQDRWGYRTACEYLLKIRTLHEKLEDSEGWINYLTDLRKRTNRLRSFKEELANASL